MAWLHPSGYGTILRMIDGKRKPFRVHVVACEVGHGPKPDGKQVAHSCHNRACCNPRHLRWATSKENIGDSVAAGRTAKGDRNGTRLHPELLPRGETNGMAKLTATTVVKIRRLYASGKFTQTELGARFDVVHSAIGSIVRRRCWTHVP